MALKKSAEQIVFNELISDDVSMVRIRSAYIGGYIAVGIIRNFWVDLEKRSNAAESLSINDDAVQWDRVCRLINSYLGDQRPNSCPASTWVIPGLQLLAELSTKVG